MEEAKANYPMAYSGAIASGQIAAMDSKMHNPTIRENIDNRIARAEAQVEQLKAVRVQMEKSGLLDVKIYDLREAMNF